MLDGRAAELERDAPFAPFVDAVDDYLASLNPRAFATLGDQNLAELARMFPRGARSRLGRRSGRLGAGTGRDERLGRRVSRRGRPGDAETGVRSLSGRELEIAELVCEGRTNREIAEVLFLSPKTIESHLSRVFSKLGVSSRAQVAREVERARERQP